MYYTDLSGTVRSFNYGTTVSSYLLPNGQPGTRQLANTNYGICVDMVAGYCGIQWSQSSDIYSFTVSGGTSIAVGQGTIATSASFINGTDCTTDFIVVPNPSVNGVPTRTDRFCGNGLPTLTTYSKPFVLTTVTNGDDLPDSGNRGFALSYTQLRCTNIIVGR
ncbi:intraflagellar transport protein 122 family protein-related [Holotrichia oblita]|nr:intraflagellar transport protein 122 family protein-related [Holotrichia oblita]